MQNKGAIRLLAILLALVTIYQLSFSYLSNKVEKAADEYAQGDSRLKYFYLDSVQNLPVVDFPVLKNITYQDSKEKEINLGLDLKGGMNVTLEVSVVDVIKSLSGYSKDSVFLAALERANQYQKAGEADFVGLFARSFNEIDPNARLATIFATLELKDKVRPNSTNEEVIEVIRAEAENAIEVSFNVLRSRIDKFGVAQPNIQRLENTGRILVELPGVKEPERVRKLLQGTASLEFWETYRVGEIVNSLDEANKRLAELKKLESGDTIDTPAATEAAEVALETEATSPNEELLTSEEDTTQSLLDELAGDEAALDSSFIREQQLKDNPIWAILSVPQYTDGNIINSANVGYVHKKDTAKMNEYLRNPEVQSLLPRDIKFAWTFKPVGDTEDFFQLVALKVTSRDGLAPLDGSAIRDARQGFGQMGGNADVSMQMTPEGSKIWARLTKENIGREVAIVLDGYVYSFPTVQNEIKNGNSQITGDFTITEAQDLANVLKSGKLPAPARIVEEAIVGPSLGKEAINSGLWSFVIAFIFVLIYMIFYYNRAGLVANIALISNIFFIFGVLASFGAVLTLPGIAGIVLTIGMSVDANVLIYERIREELRSGKGLKLALKDGYRNAYSAIVDANITTLLTAIVLVYFGKGPIQGFATTLIIGIMTSLFSAIFITRLVFERMLEKSNSISFATKMTENLFTNLKIQFLDKRKTFYIISAVAVVISLGSLFTKGLNLGVDFLGGRTYVVRFEESVSTSDVSQRLADVYGQAPEVKIFGSDNQVKVTTKYMIDYSTLEDSEVNQEQLFSELSSLLNGMDYSTFQEQIASVQLGVDDVVEMKLYLGLKDLLGGISYDDFISDSEDVEYGRMSSQKVGPTIAEDIKTAAVWALLISLIIMFLYIMIRFRYWQYGLGAVAAIMHDAIIVLGFFSLFYGILPFSLEIDQAFIAAILTVIGYSINDTVVVFDRIREWMGLHPNRERKVVYNDALNSTVSRTFSTSLSTFVVLLAIFLFGGETIRGFVFSMMIGVIVGTYSSLFIATPIAYEVIERGEQKALKNKKN